MKIVKLTLAWMGLLVFMFAGGFCMVGWIGVAITHQHYWILWVSVGFAALIPLWDKCTDFLMRYIDTNP